MRWKTDIISAKISTKTVTFVWSGAAGLYWIAQAGFGGFTLTVNGRPAVLFGAVRKPTLFPGLVRECRLLYDIKYDNIPFHTSGVFYLTVPTEWIKPGEPALIEATVEDIFCQPHDLWFAPIKSDDIPVSIPIRNWAYFFPCDRPDVPPPADMEASYEWYLRQYSDPTLFTMIGSPADPAETAVSPNGQLMQANGDSPCIPGTSYTRNSLTFALHEGKQIVPIGFWEPARQRLTGGYIPIVTTIWRYGDIELREIAYAEPLKGASYETGLESTLAWAAFDIINHGSKAREVTLLASQMNNQKTDFTYKNGVVFRKNSSALISARVPTGFATEYHPVFLADLGSAPASDSESLEILRSNQGLYNVLAVRGNVEPGKPARVVFNRVFDFPGAEHWKAGDPPMVAPDELTHRSFDDGLKTAEKTWARLSHGISPFNTPEPMLNNIVKKAMLDGYILTKRWNSRNIVFDSPGYRCQYDDACTKWFYALDLMGGHETAAKLLDTTFERQGERKPTGTRTHTGCFSDVTNIESDGGHAAWSSCNGWALWAMAEHARLTNDKAWVSKYKSKIVAGCRWIFAERQFSREKPDNPCAGLIYGRYVCDLQGDNNCSSDGYFTYTDAISYMGVNEMAHLLADWGYPEGTEMLKEAELYRGDIIAAVDKATDKSCDPWYIPWVLHAPKYRNQYLFNIVGPINLAFGCGNGGVLPRDGIEVSHVIRCLLHAYNDNLEATACASMFYSQDLAITLLELGRVEEFLRIFYTLLAANISHETLTTCEWRTNTQPHVHSIASLIRMFRTIMVQERDGALYLLQGTPRRWLKEDNRIQIKDAPTWYGPLSLSCASNLDAGNVKVNLEMPARIGSTPVRLKIRLPDDMVMEKVAVNCREHGDIDVAGEWINLQGLAGTVEVEIKVAQRARLRH